MAHKLLLVLSNPVEGREDEYNKWYDGVHLRDVCAVPGVVSAQRYDAAAGVPPPEAVADAAAPATAAPAPRHLAVYEIDGDPAAVFNEFVARVGDGRMQLSDTLDVSSIAMTVWTPREGA